MHRVFRHLVVSSSLLRFVCRLIRYDYEDKMKTVVCAELIRMDLLDRLNWSELKTVTLNGLSPSPDHLLSLGSNLVALTIVFADQAPSSLNHLFGSAKTLTICGLCKAIMARQSSFAVTLCGGLQEQQPFTSKASMSCQ